MNQFYLLCCGILLALVIIAHADTAPKAPAPQRIETLQTEQITAETTPSRHQDGLYQ